MQWRIKQDFLYAVLKLLTAFSSGRKQIVNTIIMLVLILFCTVLSFLHALSNLIYTKHFEIGMVILILYMRNKTKFRKPEQFQKLNN
jgi:Ca2+-dependent lipid-binding protein